MMKQINYVLILLSPLLLSLSNIKATSFSVDFIHRDSPLSPFYNSSMSQTEVALNAALRSISRMNNFGSKIDSMVVPNGGDYLMKIFIGTPPVEKLVIADTRGDLIWVQCLPCTNCYPQETPKFDPTKSSTYRSLSCGTTCSSYPMTSCGESNKCSYLVKYEDGSKSKGELASDVIALDSGGGKLVASNGLTVIGCGHINIGNFKNKETGIVGLGGGKMSLVSQLGDTIGHTFLYCLLPRDSTLTSKLTFGNQSTLTGPSVVSTPMDKKIYYHLSLKGISIEKSQIINTTEYESDIVIDSGTTLNMLKPNLYDRVERVVKNITKSYSPDASPVSNPPNPFKLCYGEDEIDALPDTIYFHFAEDATIALEVYNVFMKVDNMYCLATVPSKGISIFGNLAQVNFKVEFDLQKGRVSFLGYDCTNYSEN